MWKRDIDTKNAIESLVQDMINKIAIRDFNSWVSGEIYTERWSSIRLEENSILGFWSRDTEVELGQSWLKAKV